MIGRTPAILGLFASVAIAFPASAQQAPAAPQVGLMVVAHGAGPGWNADVRATASQVRWNRGPVAVAFLMGPEMETAGWDSASLQLKRQGATSFVVVPLMVSTFGAHYRQIQFYAGFLPAMPAGLENMGHHAVAPPTVPIAITGALDDAAEIGDALADHWRALSAANRTRPLMLVAHGPEEDVDADRWTANLSRAAAPLRAAGFTGEFRVGLIRDDASAPVKAAAVAAMRDTVSALAQRGADSVVVLPVMIASGPLTYTDIPRHFAGLPIVGVPFGLTPNQAMARWIERVASVATPVSPPQPAHNH